MDSQCQEKHKRKASATIPHQGKYQRRVQRSRMALGAPRNSDGNVYDPSRFLSSAMEALDDLTTSNEMAYHSGSLLSESGLFHPRSVDPRVVEVPSQLTLLYRPVMSCCRTQRTIRTPLHLSTLPVPFTRTMRPKLPLRTGFQLAVTVLLDIVPVRPFSSIRMVLLHVN